MLSQLLSVFIILSFLLQFNLKINAVTPKNPLPTGTQVNWDKLIDENQSPTAKKFIKSSFSINERLLYAGIPYPNKSITNTWENGYQSAYDKFIYMRKNGVDCTRLLRYLFLYMLNIPYNSQYPKAPIISNTFTDGSLKSQKQLKNFIPIHKTAKGFRPQIGDILSFPGHSIAVLDPKNCIAIQSSIWLCKKIKNGFCIDAEYGKSAGVSIYRLSNDRYCKNGYWKGMDNAKLNFTSAWRHRAFDTWITEMPTNAQQKSRINLVGKNLAGKYIYFTGSTTPVKAKLLKRNSLGLQSVFLNVPKDAKTGLLKIYWGTGKPKFEKTIESPKTLMIVQKRKNMVSN